MTTTIRLTLKLHRFEIGAVLLASAALAAAALVVARLLDDVGVPASCRTVGQIQETPATCLALMQAWSAFGTRYAVHVFQVIGLLPIGAGLLLGAPLLARELERGTAPLPWTLTGSRRRWLLTRAAILGVVLLVALVPVALASERLEASWAPAVDPGRSFLDDNYRGPILVVRGIATFTVAVLVGLVVGRQLPALIVGLAASAVIVLGGLAVMDRWYDWTAVYEVAVPGNQSYAGHIMNLLRRAPDGRVMADEEAGALAPPNPELPPGAIDGTWLDEHFEQVWLLVPGDRYPDAVAFHSGVLLTVSVLAVCASVALVRRRRPV
ncbi:MAG: hypothetical protein ACYDAN_14060 [Candidatus Limnocylindrales bacterium]